MTHAPFTLQKYAQMALLVLSLTWQSVAGQHVYCRNQVDSYTCYHWSRKGMCRDPRYRSMMMKNCQKMCNLCRLANAISPMSNCHDNRRKCLQWRHMNHCKEDSRYYKFMKKNCARTCMFCTDVRCVDEKTRCPRYQMLDYCKKGHQYFKFMRKNCEKSCGFCKAPPERDNKVRTRISQVVKEFSCDFEEDECDWSNSHFEDTADWKVGVDRFGPRTGFNNSAKYLYLDTLYEDYYALLWLPWELILPDNERNKGDMCFHFWYQMTDGKITVSVKANPYVHNKYSKPVIKFITQRRTNEWKHVKIHVPVSDRYQLYIKGFKGYRESFIAIDNVFFTRGSCHRR